MLVEECNDVVVLEDPAFLDQLVEFIQSHGGVLVVCVMDGMDGWMGCYVDVMFNIRVLIRRG